jgi:ABC-type nitrate/sulfonate/bicarbonate transport system substrate-binding protein
VNIFTSATLFVLGLIFAAAPAYANEAVVYGGSAATSRVIPLAGIDKGFFKAAGLDVTNKELTRGGEALEATVAGSIQFASAANSAVLAAAAQKLPLVVIGMVSHGFYGRVIAAKKNAALKTLQDYKGKRLGIQVGTGTYTIFLLALEKLHMQQSDFVLSNIRVADMPAAMTGDTFDAVVAWEPQASRILQAGNGVEIISPDDFEKLAGVSDPTLLVTSAQTIHDRPDLVQAFVTSYRVSQRYIDAHRAEAVAIYRKNLGPLAKDFSDADLTTLVFGPAHYDRLLLTDQDVAGIAEISDFLVKQKTLRSAPDLTKLIDMRFAKKAEESIAKQP